MSLLRCTTAPAGRLVRAPWTPELVILGLFVLLTAVSARNVLGGLDSVIIGIDPDAYINPWADWWTAKAIRDPQLSLWYTDYLFFPHGVDLTFHSFSHLNTLVSLALRPLFGPLPAYNLTVLTNFVLAGFAMYQLARYLTGSRAAAMLAGIVFAFNSHNLYESAHPVIFTIWPIPWATMYLMQAAREQRQRYALAAALFVVLCALASTLLLIMLSAWLLALTAYMMIGSRWPRASWRILGLFGTVSILCVLPISLPLIRSALAEGNNTFIIEPGVAQVSDILSPFIPHWYSWFVHGLYFGVAPFYLSMVALGYRRRQTRLWWLLLVVAYLFTIGPRPRFLTFELGITLPWSNLIVPILRHGHRINVLLSLALSMLVAHGWLAIKERSRSARTVRTAFLVVTLLLVLEYAIVPLPLREIEISAFYTNFLEGKPDDVALAILPTGRQEDKRYMYYQTVHGHKITGGVISRSSDSVFNFIYRNPLLRAGAADLNKAAIPENPLPHLEALARQGVAYLVLDKRQMDVEPWREALSLTPAFEDHLLLVYATRQAVLTYQSEYRHRPPLL